MNLTTKQRKWLERISQATDGSGMYPGERQDFVSWKKVACPLWKRGFIQEFIPHNPVHKERWIITEAGRRALETSDD